MLIKIYRNNKGVIMELQSGMKLKDCKEVSKILNVLLADEYVLYVKTLNYHWNVVGPRFNDLHAFFERQYRELFEIVDAVAERARMVGQYSIGSMQEFMNNTRLTEDIIKHHPVSDDVMIKNLLIDYEAIICSLRIDLVNCMEKYNDAGTSNFLNDLLEKHEKSTWMLRSLLTK
jgi:starvation-inducible DNA-binding protein